MTCRAPIMRFAYTIAWLSLAFLPLHAAAARINAVPPAKYPGHSPGKFVAKATLVAADAPARRIDLAAPTETEAAPMKMRNAAPSANGDRRVPLTIGYGRVLPAIDRTMPLASLKWTPSADGGRIARIEVASPGAAAIRVALELSGARPGLEFRFAGVGAGSSVFGPYAAQTIASDGGSGGVFWSPVLEGAVAIVELHMAADASSDGAVLTIPRISHQVVSSANLRALSAKDAKAIGSSGSCNVDIACIVPPTQAILDAATSVVRLNFVWEDGRSVVCTGTLLNDSVRSFTPYVYTANHCIDSAHAARTLNTYWFYDAIACNSKATPPFVQLVNGATLLARSPDADWSLVRLLDTPPTGAGFAAWRADALTANEAVATIHHPQGDLKKWSQGTFRNLSFLSDEQVFQFFSRVTWNLGTTEPGSSGSPLFTLSSGGHYEVRGGLFAGEASCTVPLGSDYFTRLEQALPWLRDYLTPDVVNPIGLVPAIEFYNRDLDHYFLSTNPIEIGLLDTGVTRGWVRTGLRFLVYSTPVPGATEVCRFYRAPGFGDSHFYSASPSECAATAAAHPIDWVYESPNVFYAQLPHPGTGLCPAGTEPVYRYFNHVTTNHRYTTQVTLADTLAASSAWTAEGYGPGPYYPAMCAALE